MRQVRVTHRCTYYILDSRLAQVVHMVCAKMLCQFPCWSAKELSPMYFKWCEHNFQMRTVNLLVVILMPYMVKLFYEHSTLKLWLKILLPRGKKSNFQHFWTMWLKYYIVLKWQITLNFGLTSKKCGIKVVRNWILYKKVCERLCLSPHRVEIGDLKDSHLQNIIMYKNGKVDSVWGSMLPKIHITSKNIEIKVVRNWILYKKVYEGIVLPPSRVELGDSKDTHIWNIIMYKN